MIESAPRPNFLYPLIRPVVPAPEEWVPFLGESYRRHWFSNFGPAAALLEAGLAAEFGEPEDKFVVTSSATAALCACLIAKRVVGRVLVPAFTFPATIAAIRMAGAEPWLVDVNAATWSLDLDRLGDALDKTRVEAVMPVSPFGITQDFSIDLLGRFDELSFPEEVSTAPWQVFPCLLPSAALAARFVEEAARRGLEIRRYYRPSLSEWGGIPLAGDCSTADDLAERMVCLPVYSRPIEGELAAIHRIVALVMEYLLPQGRGDR